MGGIYIHIPFCTSHCTYCGFYSELLPRRGSERVCCSEGARLDGYVDALCTEIRLSGALDGMGGGFDKNAGTAAGGCAKVETLYIGGGTPSVLSVAQIGKIVRALDGSFQLRLGEFTVEVNPDDIVRGGKDYAAGLRSIGVSRVSMGIQSFDDKVLRRMGRRHNAAQAAQAYRILQECGFDNISVDIIFGSEAQWDVETVRSGLLNLSGDHAEHGDLSGLPRHISCYQLSVEEGSGLEKMIAKGLYSLPDDETCAAQYSALCKMLASLGYEHYEVSNWALPGYRSRHNSSYWNHTPYLGLGPAAHSLIISQKADSQQYTRRWNKPDTAAYVSAMKRIDGACLPEAKAILAGIRGYETLTAEQVGEEKVMLGLRTAEGIDPDLVPPASPSSALLEKTCPENPNGRLRIPEDRWFISDSIIADLI